jgi:hypothetical protein
MERTQAHPLGVILSLLSQEINAQTDRESTTELILLKWSGPWVESLPLNHCK